MLIDFHDVFLTMQRNIDERERQEKRYTELAEKIAETLATKFAEVLEKKLKELNNDKAN
jgi:hypothetical protein